LDLFTPKPGLEFLNAFEVAFGMLMKMHIMPRRSCMQPPPQRLSPDSIESTYAFALARILAKVFWTSKRAWIPLV
jgi:hypothetical protein